MATEELCLICWARGRGGLGGSGFNDYNNYDDFGSSGYGGYGGGSSGGRGRAPRGGRTGGRGGGRSGSGGGSGGQMTVVNSTTGHSLHMRGLPFDSSEEDIIQFFSPLTPVSIRIVYEPNGRPKGEADVDFATHDAATAAMGKHKQNMGRRYIELFLQSTQNGFPGGTGGGWSTGPRSNSTGYTDKGGMPAKGSYGGGYGGTSPASGYGSGYGSAGYGVSRLRGSEMSGYGDLTEAADPYRDTTNFAADVTYPGAGNFFGQQSGFN